MRDYTHRTNSRAKCDELNDQFRDEVTGTGTGSGRWWWDCGGGRIDDSGRFGLDNRFSGSTRHLFRSVLTAAQGHNRFDV